jgi:hypothetical protein
MSPCRRQLSIAQKAWIPGLHIVRGRIRSYDSFCGTRLPTVANSSSACDDRALQSSGRGRAPVTVHGELATLRGVMFWFVHVGEKHSRERGLSRGRLLPEQAGRSALGNPAGLHQDLKDLGLPAHHRPRFAEAAIYESRGSKGGCPARSVCVPWRRAAKRGGPKLAWMTRQPDEAVFAGAGARFARCSIHRRLTSALSASRRVLWAHCRHIRRILGIRRVSADE